MSPTVRRFYFSATVHPLARAWVAAGGVPDGNQLQAMSRFFTSIASVRPKIGRLNLLCGGLTSGLLIPQITGYVDGVTLGAATDTNAGFVGGDFTNATGLQGANAKSFSLGTSPINLSMTISDAHLGAGVLADSAATSDMAIISAYDSGFVNMADQSARGGSTNRVGGQFHANSTLSVIGSTLNAPRRQITSATSNTDLRAYANGAQSGTTQTNTRSGTLTTRPLFFMAGNNAGTASFFFQGRASYYHAGLGLTAAEVATLDAALAQFLADIGRA